MDPRRILALLDAGDRAAAEAELSSAFVDGAPSRDAPTATRFCHALHLLLARSWGRPAEGAVVMTDRDAHPGPRDDAVWAAGIRAVHAMVEAAAAVTEGRVDDLVVGARRAAALVPRPMPWLELHVAALVQAAYRFDGDPELYREALAACRAASDRISRPHVAVQARALMGSVHLLRGRYHATLDLCDAALDLAATAGIDDAPAAAMAHQFRGYVLFEWNRLDDARGALDHAWTLAGAVSRGVGSGVARMQAQLAAAGGDAEGAELWLKRLEEIVSEPMTLRNREWLTAVQVRHTLGRGDLRGVEDWLRAYDYRAHAGPSATPADILSRLHELDHVLTLMELTAQWEEIHALAPRVRRAAAGRRAWFEAHAAATDAVALEAMGRPGEAERVWEEALAIGEEGSFVRLYAEGGDVRRRLVRRMAERDVGGRSREIAGALAEPRGTEAALTNKQREVLSLVGDGLSNKAVAQALGISLSTVKTHLREAFRRLGATSRTHALAEARKRGVLER